MQLHMGQRLGAEQRLEMRLELRPALMQPWEPEERWLSGDPHDLELLLSTHPQLDEDGGLHYLVSGGWGVELLTGVSREHHDLDVVRLSKAPLTFRMDEQQPHSYFGVLSFTAEEIITHHVRQAEWRRPSDGQSVTVYVPSPEYLLVSKISGFMRQPREKDYPDIEALARNLDVSGSHRERLRSQFQNLVLHIPHRSSQFQLNRQLLAEMTTDHTRGQSASALAANHLLEIVEGYQQGGVAREVAARKVRVVHDWLQQIYEQGLAGAVSMRAKGIRPGIYEWAWDHDGIGGFWVDTPKGPDLRVFAEGKDRRQLKVLDIWQSLESRVGAIMEMPERFNSHLWLAKGGDGAHILTPPNNGRLVSDRTHRYTHVEKYGDEFIGGIDAHHNVELLDARGNLLFRHLHHPWGIVSFYAIHSGLLAKREFDLARRFGTANPVEADRSIQSWYSTLLQSGEWEEAFSFGSRFSIETGGRDREYYNGLLSSSSYARAREFAAARKLKTRDEDRTHMESMIRFGRIAASKSFLDSFGQTGISPLTELVQGHIDTLVESGQPSDVNAGLDLAVAHAMAPSLAEEQYRMAILHFMEGPVVWRDVAGRIASVSSLSQDQQARARDKAAVQRVGVALGATLDVDIELHMLLSGLADLDHPVPPDVARSILYARPYSPAVLRLPRGNVKLRWAHKAYGELVKSQNFDAADDLREHFGLPARVDQYYFLKHPERYAAYDQYKRFVVDATPVQGRVMDAALTVLDRRLFGAGAERGKARGVIDYFGIPMDIVHRRILDRADTMRKRRGSARAVTDMLDKMLAPGLLPVEMCRDYAVTWRAEAEARQQYVDAAHIAYELLDDLPAAQEYVRKAARIVRYIPHATYRYFQMTE